MKTVNAPKQATKQPTEINYTLTTEAKAIAKFFKRSFSWDSTRFEVAVEIRDESFYSSTYSYKQEIIEYYTKEDGAPLKEVSKIERALVYGNSLGEKEAKDEYDWKPITREEFEEIRRQALILFNNPLSIKKTIEIEVSY